MADGWEALERDCGQCRSCSLWETRKHVVFGDGSRAAEIMLVGEENPSSPRRPRRCPRAECRKSCR